MSLTELARQYCTTRRIAFTPLHSVNRFVRVMGEIPIGELSTSHCEQFRSACIGKNSAWTIEKTLVDLVTVVESAGKTLDKGRPLRRNRPVPSPIPTAFVDDSWPHMSDWLRQWVVLAYWTGLRLDNVIELQCGTDGCKSDRIHYRASKTGHIHVFPVVDWLRPWLSARSLPYSRANDHAQALVRIGIGTACRDANLEPWLPKFLRQRCLTEWSRANAAAGAILHGSGLRVLSHYVEPLAVLESASYRVRLPACFGATQDCGESLLRNFARCDEQAKSIVSLTAERLAAG